MHPASGRLGDGRWLLVAVLLLSACGASVGAQQATTPGGVQTAVVQRGAIESTISASGSVTARADVSLTPPSNGTIAEVLIKAGDRVKSGQPLLRLDDRELQLQLAQAEANLSSAQAKLDETRAGATEKQVADAEASLRSAEAKYQQTARGTTTPQDVASAEASLRSAEAKLAATIAGTTTPQDLTNAEASLSSAEAKLAAVIAGTTTPQDIASSEASVRSAEAKLAELSAGPSQTEIDSAVQKLNQARENRTKTTSNLATAKEQARLAIDLASDDLRSAQAAYGASKLLYDEASRTGKDPTITACPPTNRGCADLSDAKLRQFKADFESKQLALSKAEQTVTTRTLAYEDSKRQEISGLRTADSQVLEAEAALDGLKAGPSPEQVTQAQASVDQARSALEKLQQPARATDVAQAQLAVEQARASLEKLQQPAKASDITQARAAVDQARASLEKLQRGPAEEELTVAQTAVDQAASALNELRAGPTESALATALATVKQNEATRDVQRFKLSQATITAPFDGVIAAVNGLPGQQSTSTATTPLIAIVDDSQLRIDLRVAESDVARLRLNQEARITFDALPERTITGRVSFIAPKATVEQNVVFYLVSITLAGTPESSVRPGMTANVGIVTERKDDVLIVPSRAIRTVGGGRTVEVRYRDLTFAVPVQVGLTGDSGTEIISGLKEGDVIVIGSTTAPATTKPGGNVGFPAPAVKK